MIPIDTILPARPGKSEYDNLREWAESVDRSYSEHTFRSWRQHLRYFYTYCEERGLVWFPASATTIMNYLRDHQYGWAPGTQALSMSVLKTFHQNAGARSGFDDEDVRLVIRELNDAVRMQDSARFTANRLLAVTNRLGKTTIAIWAKAIIWFTYDTRYRTTALLEVNQEDITRSENGTAHVAAPRKPDIWTWKGGHLALTTVRLLDDWISQIGTSAGPLFPRVSPKGRIRTENVTTGLLRMTLVEALRAAGIDPRDFHFRSIRAGAIKDMEDAQVGLFNVKVIGGHSSVEVAREYVRDIDDTSSLQLAEIQNR